MREFVIVGHEAPTTPDFSLDDLPGAGRLDVLSRCVTSALLVSHGIREDVQVELVLGDSYVVRFEGEVVRRLNPDERSTAARIRAALGEREEAVGAMAAEASPGVSIRRGDLEAALDSLRAETVVQLHESGEPVVDLEPPDEPAFVLSDHRSFTEEEASLLTDVVDHRVSLGPRALHADQAITVAHNYLDTDGFASY